MAYSEKEVILGLRRQALFNIEQALHLQRAHISDVTGEGPISNAASVINSAVVVLSHLDDDCPTCPYLDSLEDEDEDFCECGAGEEEESVEDFVSYLDPSFDPTFGTFLIFCKN